MGKMEANRQAHATNVEQLVRPRHIGKWLSGAVALAILIPAIVGMVTNPRFQWEVVSKYFLDPRMTSGVLKTLELTGLAMLVGIVLGLVLAVMRMSKNPVLVYLSLGYLWVFRGAPLLVQLLFWFNISALIPIITLGIPFGPVLFEGSANAFITPYLAALLGLGLYEAAYMSEIIRSGLLAVDSGQREAAQVLGMSQPLLMRRIVLPQAMRIIVPTTGNEAIRMLKDTSLVSVLAIPELLYSAQMIYSRTFETIPLLLVAGLWYVIATTALMIGQYYLEKYFSSGTGRASGPKLTQAIEAGSKRLPAEEV